MADIVGQESVEALIVLSPDGLIGQESIEALIRMDPNARQSQVAIEVLAPYERKAVSFYVVLSKDDLALA